MSADRHPYGSVKQGILEWIETAPDGKEFYYGDIADDLGVPRPTVSASILKLVRDGSDAVVFGKMRGYYAKPDADRPAVSSSLRRSASVQGPPRAGEQLEVVGLLKSGSLLLRAEDGTLWEAKEL